VSGEKRWLVYEPVWPLPLKEQRYRPSMGEPGEPVEDVVLKPGDTLYLPRGWLHEAVTSGTDSLHITVGVSVYTWLDAFKAALSECAGDLPFRETPTGEADELLERLRERLAPDEIESRRRRRLLRTRRPLRGDQFDQLRALERLRRETTVERRRSVIADLRSSGDRLVLAFEGKEIAFPAHVESEVRFVAAAEEPFSPAELPGDLDDEGRLVLMRRLVREGFLRIREPGGPSPRSDGHAGALPPRT
jgi:hypothetical protein